MLYWTMLKCGHSVQEITFIPPPTPLPSCLPSAIKTIYLSTKVFLKKRYRSLDDLFVLFLLYSLTFLWNLGWTFKSIHIIIKIFLFLYSINFNAYYEIAKGTVLKKKFSELLILMTSICDWLIMQIPSQLRIKE